ncbi:carbon monoxide dehydrogenase subunit G, partial [Streptomyces albiflaviniger]|nr:carbon monoxide dehydrogenase subunit G [Streptomyces albiflaviniger]
MEHEVFVPFPVDTVRLALAEPARVARCVPGLQQDADEAAGPLAGRLRLRIGGSTITYRGVLRVVRRADAFEVEGEGGEARGSGSVKLALTITPKPVEGGTVLNCSGTVH